MKKETIIRAILNLSEMACDSSGNLMLDIVTGDTRGTEEYTNRISGHVKNMVTILNWAIPEEVELPKGANVENDL